MTNMLIHTISTLSIFFSIFPFQQVSAAAIAPRAFAGCAVLNTNLYCYGGYLGAQAGHFTQPTSDHYTVDLSTSSLDRIKATLNWTNLQPPAANQGPALEPRGYFPITAIDQSRYVILGGATSNATLNTPAIIYDSSKNVWEALADPPFYMSSGAMVASSGGNGNTLWAYGGTLNSSSALTPKSTLRLDLSSLPGTWTVRANSGNLPPNTRHGHAAVLRNNLIYYFGGFFAVSPTQSNPVPMNRVNFYNTQSDQWGTIICGGDNPRNRTYHTATLIGNSSKVLIYGGTGNDSPQDFPLKDYAYLWDTNTHNYLQLNQTPGDPGPRIGHSAVQYENTILIAFGFDSSGNIRGDVTLLDVSSPGSPYWVGASPSPTNGSDDTDGGNTNVGAIVGGVIGGVAGIAIIAGIVFYIRRRKNNQHVKNDFDLDQPPQGFHTDDSPTLFTSSDGNRYSDADNNKATTAIATGNIKKNNNNNININDDPVPNYHHIKPDESEPHPSNDFDPLTRVKPSGND